MIGIFDSGLGGLTVVREVMRQMPGYPVVYFGDTARTPYGTKSKRLIERYAVEDAEFLLKQGAELIVVACNTASALAMDALRTKIDVPLFEVVTPAVRKAAGVTNGRVGVVGTRATVKSGVYEKKMSEESPHSKVFASACPLFVPLVEEGWHDTPEAASIAKRYLSPLKLHGIDTLILGCTHYPFLKGLISDAVGKQVALIDPAKETVRELRDYLGGNPDLDRLLRKDGSHSFFTSDKTDHFARIASEWLGDTVALEESKTGCS